MITKPTIHTKEYVLKELKGMLEYVNKDQGVVFINGLFTGKPYSRQRFSEWSNKYKDNKEIQDTLKKIENILEDRVVDGALKGVLNNIMSIFLLKNKYLWKDKHETDITSGGQPIPLLNGLEAKKPDK